MGSLPKPGYEPRTTDPAAAGAIGELVVSTDLMRRGYHVFRALSPSCPSDLLVYRYDPDRLRAIEAWRIQVRNAVVRGKAISFLLKDSDAGKFDILALPTKDDQVYYLPALPGTPVCPYGVKVEYLQMLRSWGVLRGAGWQGMKANLEAYWSDGQTAMP